MTALHNAWLLAKAHGHHWASDATPAVLAFARALPEWLWRDPGRDLPPPLRDEWEEITTSPPTDGGHAPATYEEAELLGRLPTSTGSGRTVPPLAGDGSLSAGTGSGRLRWTCSSSGAVDLWIDRPAPDREWPSREGVTVIHATILPGGAVRVTRLGAYMLRHAASLGDALRALGVPEREYRLVALGAEDAGELYQRPAIRRGESEESYFARADAAREEYLQSPDLLWIDRQQVSS
jgi:hypothetical protein